MSTTTALIILGWALGAGLVCLLFYIWCRDEPDDDEWTISQHKGHYDAVYQSQQEK